tara:strand:+ start:779 stop:1258 length:480 start_codon:yes stop_codon:yes gene_type:complete
VRIRYFERVVRRAGIVSQQKEDEEGVSNHPFFDRSIYDRFPPKVKKLFDDAHYSEATFEAFKFLDKRVAKLAGSRESGQKLMMQALSETGAIKLNNLSNDSELDEQNGYKFLFAGAMSAVRNPRGHEYDFNDSIESCLDHLSLASFLIRRLEQAGYELD